MVAWSRGRAFDAPVWLIKSLELGSEEDHAEIVFRSQISVHCRTIRHPTIEEHPSHPVPPTRDPRIRCRRPDVEELPTHAPERERGRDEREIEREREKERRERAGERERESRREGQKEWRERAGETREMRETRETNESRRGERERAGERETE